MSNSEKLLTKKYFPTEDVPFGAMLNAVFFQPRKDNLDFPLHGPNVIRFVEALSTGQLQATGLFTGNVQLGQDVYHNYYSDIQKALGIELGSHDADAERRKVTRLLKVAALYHDIGKAIRRGNHPQIGANLIRHFDETESKKLLKLLSEAGKNTVAHSRFSLIASTIQHHDKFGVVNTGEGGLPIFADILYFTSNIKAIEGIKKNITSVMLLNLADIAAVCTAPVQDRKQAVKIADGVHRVRRKKRPKPEFKDMSEGMLLKQLSTALAARDVCLGLTPGKVEKVLNDWDILLEAVDHPTVRGDRIQLKRRLIEIERFPSRSINRILRLLSESIDNANVRGLEDYITPTSVEAVLVGTLGAHQFQTFCEQLATVVKLDYGLNFFQAICCGCARKCLNHRYRMPLNKRKKLDWRRLNDEEAAKVRELSPDKKSKLAEKITALFVRVLNGLMTRYLGVLYSPSANPRRFGFQMRALTDDVDIRDTVIDMLCIEEFKDSIALNWIADEVTIWSMD